MKETFMRSILILAGCLALASVAAADQNKHKNKPGNQAAVQQQQVQQQHLGKAGKHSIGAAGLNQQQQLQTNSQLRMQHKALKTQSANLPGSQSSNVQITKNKTFTKNVTNVHVTKNFAVTKNFNNKYQAINFMAFYILLKFFVTAKNFNNKYQAIKFQPGVRIQGSQNWKGTKYIVFRTYTPLWHDRIWWISNHPRIVLIGGGWYYWDNNYWYPAWGYDPGARFVYDGPIYAYNDLDPGQVVANVQAKLQEQGYYQGEVDGLMGPLTRAALARYQADHGLYETAAIDEPTMESLGFA